MRKLILLLALAAPIQALGGEVTLIPPKGVVAAGAPFLLEIRGLAAADLPRTAVVAEPKATSKAAIVPGPFGGQFIWCEASTEGQRVIVLAICTDTRPIVVATVVQVGGGPQPSPNPEPEPNPTPPPPPGERKIVVILEISEQTSEQAAVVQQIDQYADSHNHWFRPADPNLETAEGEPAPWLQPYLQAVKTRSVDLPVLIIDGPPFDVLDSSDAVEPLPDVVSRAIELIQENGG